MSEKPHLLNEVRQVIGEGLDDDLFDADVAVLLQLPNHGVRVSMQRCRGIGAVYRPSNPDLQTKRQSEIRLRPILFISSIARPASSGESLSPYQPSPSLAARLSAGLLLPPTTIGMGVRGRGENSASEKLMWSP